MTAAVLKRGVAPPRGARAKPTTRAVYKPAPVTVRLPIERKLLIRRTVIGFAVLLIAVALLLATLAGVPQRLWAGVLAASARQGFEVHQIEVSGNRELSRLDIIGAAFRDPSSAMLTTDLGAMRERLLALPWVADASVSRRLPDGISISVVERRPIALWQINRRFKAIDGTGKDLTSDRLDRFVRLPVVIGPGANLRVREALGLLARQPRLGAKTTGITLVGARRWDVKFTGGEVLMLPEVGADTALAHFARMDAHGDGLLGRGFDRFDMRLPGKMVVRGPAVKAAIDAAAKAAKAAQKQLAV